MGEPITVKAERYLDHLTVERGLSEHTLMAYRRDLRRYLEFLAKRDITEPGQVEEATIRSFVASLSAAISRFRWRKRHLVGAVPHGASLTTAPVDTMRPMRSEWPTG